MSAAVTAVVDEARDAISLVFRVHGRDRRRPHGASRYGVMCDDYPASLSVSIITCFTLLKDIHLAILPHLLYNESTFDRRVGRSGNQARSDA